MIIRTRHRKAPLRGGGLKRQQAQNKRFQFLSNPRPALKTTHDVANNPPREQILGFNPPREDLVFNPPREDLVFNQYFTMDLTRVMLMEQDLGFNDLIWPGFRI